MLLAEYRHSVPALWQVGCLVQDSYEQLLTEGVNHAAMSTLLAVRWLQHAEEIECRPTRAGLM